MADQPKILDQRDPSAATLEDLYTVPASTSAMMSTGVVCNRSATPTAFRISIAKAGAGDSDEQYLYYDRPIGANDTFSFTFGLGLEETDVVRVYATLATLSFTVSGVEIT